MFYLCVLGQGQHSKSNKWNGRQVETLAQAAKRLTWMVTSNGNLAREKVKGSPWLTLTKGKQGSTRAETHWAILTEHKDQ